MNFLQSVICYAFFHKNGIRIVPMSATPCVTWTPYNKRHERKLSRYFCRRHGEVCAIFTTQFDAVRPPCISVCNIECASECLVGSL